MHLSGLWLNRTYLVSTICVGCMVSEPLAQMWCILLRHVPGTCLPCFNYSFGNWFKLCYKFRIHFFFLLSMFLCLYLGQIIGKARVPIIKFVETTSNIPFDIRYMRLRHMSAMNKIRSTLAFLPKNLAD